MDTIIVVAIAVVAIVIIYFIVRAKGGDLNAKLRSIFKKDQ